MTQALEEKERMDNQMADLKLQFISLNDNFLDQQLELKEKVTELDLLKSQINVLTESNNAYQKRLDDLYTNNIILPKKGDAEPVTLKHRSVPEAEFTQAM